jgi:hypothetical protein
MPVDKQVVESQLAAIGEIDRWWNTAEARLLPDILGSEETILAVVDGKLRERIRRSRRWLVVVTTHRLVALRGGRRLGRWQFEVPASELGSVSHHSGLLRTTVLLATPDQKYRLRVQKRDASRFVTALSALMNRGGSRNASIQAASPSSGSAAVDDRIDLLEDEIARLREQLDFMENLLRRRMPEVPGLEEPKQPPALPTRSAQ